MADNHTSNEKGYEIQHRDNCLLVFGQVPLRDTARMLAEAGEDDTLDLHLASLIGAALVVGHPDDLATLRQRDDLPVNPERRKEHDQAIAQGFSQQFADWLLTGERGFSSDYIAHVATGIPAEAPVAHPRDTDDLKRCFGLIKALMDDLHPLTLLTRMSACPSPWPALAKYWPLFTTYDRLASPDEVQARLDVAIAEGFGRNRPTLAVSNG